MGPRRLETSTDYRPALLWLMGELGQERTSDAVAEFERRLGGLIPAEHRELTKSGYVKWENYVRWARQALVDAGLMGSGGYGVWTITEAGQKWLQDHPDGGKRELVALIRASKAGKRKQSRSGREDVQHSIRLAGETFTPSKADVLDTVRAALAGGVPPTAQRFRRWFLPVDGKRVSVKWVMSLVTGLPTDRFTTYQARNQLRKLGLEARSTDEPGAVVPPAGDAESQSAGLNREAFYQAVLERLEGRLAAGVRNRSANPRVNYLRLNHPAPRTHYELKLHKTCTDLALVFHGPEAENRARLAPFEETLSDLEAKLEQSIQVHVGGKSYSLVRLRLPPAKLDMTTAHELADTWLAFIEVTLPLLNQVVAELGLMVRGPRPNDKQLERPRAILTREIRKIRAYLNGDRTLSPSDERMCDWVQFCYTFELFAEGMALFKLVRTDAVHPWLYERTRKLARACELRNKG